MKRAIYRVVQSSLWVLVTQFIAIGLSVGAMALMVRDPAWEMLAYLAGVLSPLLFGFAGFLIPRSFMVTSKKQLFAFLTVWLVAAVGFDVLVNLGFIAEGAEFVGLPQQLTAAAVFQTGQPGPVLQMGIHLMTILYFGVGLWFKRRNLKKRGML